MDLLPVSQRALRMCSQCKLSKKKCDKLIPKCSRCSRLALDCSYSELEKPTESTMRSEAGNTIFEEILRRLDRLESYVLSPPASTLEPDLEKMESKDRRDDETISSTWLLNPGTLRPKYRSFILTSSLLRVLSESRTSLGAIGDIYFKRTHYWLPMVSKSQFERQRAQFNNGNPSTTYPLLMLAMHLLVTPLLKHPHTDSVAESPWYRACKHHFGQYVALAEPSIELIQAGMLIALFEHYQCVENRALTTLGICIMLANALDLDDFVAQQTMEGPGEITEEEEEMTLTWWGLGLLERYLNMPPVPFPKQSSLPSKALPNTYSSIPTSHEPLLVASQSLDKEHAENYAVELSAAHLLGHAQALIRENRAKPASPFLARSRELLSKINEFLACCRLRRKELGYWAGMAVALSAGLQLVIHEARILGRFDSDTMRRIRAFVDEITSVMSQCRILNGFTENYLEGISPTWISVGFQAISACKGFQHIGDTGHDLTEIDLSVVNRLLEDMRHRYNLADHCFRLISSM